MAEFFTKLKVYEAEVENYKEQVDQYQSERVAYRDSKRQLQVAVAPAEAVVRTFFNGAGFTYVDKEDTAGLLHQDYSSHGLVQVFIILIIVWRQFYISKNEKT